jgi:PAS domain S-box-containing protein
MGGAVSSSFFKSEKVDDVFTQSVVKQEYERFIVQEHSVDSFAQFVKNGHWLGMLSHFDHCDHSKSSSKPSTPKATNRNGEVRWIYQQFIVVDQLKEQVDQFLKQSAVSADAAHANNNSSRKSWDKTRTPDFHESYKYNPETATFTLNEMSAMMCTILFPLYLGSEEYQHWRAWHVAKSKKIAGKYLASASTSDHDFTADTHGEDGTGTVDVQHMKQILLSTAAFLDEAELQQQLHKSTLFEDAHNAITSSTFAIAVCRAQSQNPNDRPVLFVNKAFEKMTGFAAKQVVGQNLQLIVGAETEKLQLERMALAMLEQKDIKLILTLYKRGGGRFVAALALKPSYDNTGNIAFWIMIFYDISRKGASLTELKKIMDLLALIPNLLSYPSPTGAY